MGICHVLLHMPRNKHEMLRIFRVFFSFCLKRVRQIGSLQSCEIGCWWLARNLPRLNLKFRAPPPSQIPEKNDEQWEITHELYNLSINAHLCLYWDLIVPLDSHSHNPNPGPSLTQFLCYCKHSISTSPRAWLLSTFCFFHLMKIPPIVLIVLYGGHSKLCCPWLAEISNNGVSELPFCRKCS